MTASPSRSAGRRSGLSAPRPSARAGGLTSWLTAIAISCCLAMAPAAASEISVVTSVPPHAWLAGEIGGDRVTSSPLVTSGQDPHGFQVSPAEAMRAARAQIYLATGMGFEQRLIAGLKANNPDVTVLDLLEIAGHGHHHDHDHDHHHEADGEHGHEHDHEHDHCCDDPHVWLDPLSLEKQARAIADALIALDPDGASVYAVNLEAFVERLTKANEDMRGRLKPYEGRSFIVFHPAFLHYAEAFGLREVPIEQAGREPTARQLLELVREARAENAAVVFVQPQFSQRSAVQLAGQIGARVEEMDPLEPDILLNFRSITDKLEAAFRGAAP